MHIMLSACLKPFGSTTWQNLSEQKMLNETKDEKNNEIQDEASYLCCESVMNRMCSGRE